MTEPAQSPRREPDPAVVDAGDGDGKGIYWVLKNVIVGPPVKRIFRPNVIGAENVVTAAIENDVPRTLSLSTDKAVNPVNLYGATKLCAEKIVSQGNAYAADSPARFATVRYGNVVGSRGSVIPLFKQQAPTGVLTITDERMTRFWITLEEAVQFVIGCLERRL